MLEHPIEILEHPIENFRQFVASLGILWDIQLGCNAFVPPLFGPEMSLDGRDQDHAEAERVRPN